MKRLDIAELEEGMVLHRDVVDRLGRRIITAGVALTARHIAAFRTFGIAAVEVVTPEVDAAAPMDPARVTAVTAELDALFARTDRAHPAVAALFRACLERRARLTAAEEKRLVFAAAPGWDEALAAAPSRPVPRGSDPTAWVRSLGTLPSLPDVYYRLTDVLDRPRAGAREIAAVIEEDAALAARVLRLVNSAFYGYPGRIDAIPQALAILGTEEIKNLALATSVFSLFKGTTAGFVTMRSFWEHGIACGVAARVVAAHRREATVDSMFIGGLLHDIGALTLCVHRAPEYTRAASAAWRAQGSLSLALRTQLGYDSAEVADVLLEAWNLPVRLRKIVAHVDDPARAGVHLVDAATVHLAHALVVAMQLGSSGELLTPPLSPPAWESLHLAPAAIPLLVAEVDRAFGDVARAILKDAA
jgi:HD-like signal output (HDOD) protein